MWTGVGLMLCDYAFNWLQISPIWQPLLLGLLGIAISDDFGDCAQEFAPAETLSRRDLHCCRRRVDSGELALLPAARAVGGASGGIDTPKVMSRLAAANSLT